MMHIIAGWKQTQLRRATKISNIMSGSLPQEIVIILQKIGGRFFRRPARDVAFWLACVPLVIPAPLIAGVIALSRRKSGDADPQWRLILCISVVNFLLSILLLTWLYYLLGEWVLDRFHDLISPFFLWPSEPDALIIPVQEFNEDYIL